MVICFWRRKRRVKRAAVAAFFIRPKRKAAVAASIVCVSLLAGGLGVAASLGIERASHSQNRPAKVPEPSSAALLAGCGVCYLVIRRR